MLKLNYFYFGIFEDFELPSSRPVGTISERISFPACADVLYKRSGLIPREIFVIIMLCVIMR